ncbi:MAG: hypothetical protein HC898_04305, partial [Phycisphaerales bacterium]|nr:hypothetical protein [Phycisphaerales bacterium]
MMMQANYWRLMGLMLCLCASCSWAQDSTVLVEGGARDTYQARRGYDVEYGTFEGRKSARMSWNAGSGTLNEIAFRGRPNVLAFEAGVKLAIEINSDDFPKLSGAGV